MTNDTKELEAPGELNRTFEFLLGKNSVITISGAEHQRQRQLLMPPFHGERMRNYSQVITDVTQNVISQYQIGKPFNIRQDAENAERRKRYLTQAYCPISEIFEHEF